MRYVLAIDGGGTKTDVVIGDERGNIIATYRDSASNYQIVGIKETTIIIEQAISNTCNLANIHYSQLSYIFLGIAGADLQAGVSYLFVVQAVMSLLRIRMAIQVSLEHCPMNSVALEAAIIS